MVWLYLHLICHLLVPLSIDVVSNRLVGHREKFNAEVGQSTHIPHNCTTLCQIPGNSSLHEWHSLLGFFAAGIQVQSSTWPFAALSQSCCSTWSFATVRSQTARSLAWERERYFSGTKAPSIQDRGQGKEFWDCPGHSGTLDSYGVGFRDY